MVHVDAVNRQNQAAMRDNTECFVAVHESVVGTKRTCRALQRMSAIEAKTDSGPIVNQVSS